MANLSQVCTEFRARHPPGRGAGQLYATERGTGGNARRQGVIRCYLARWTRCQLA